MNSTPIPRNSPGLRQYMRADAARIWPHARRRARRSGATGRHGSARGREQQQGQRGQEQGELQRTVHELHQRPRAAADGVAEEVGRRRPERAAGRHGVALVAPALRPGDRLRPLRLQVRAGRAVEERRLELAPAALEVDPRERRAGLGRVARDRRDRRAQVVVRAVVSSQPTPCSAELPRKSPRRRSSRASRRPGTRRDACRRRARACRRPSRLLRALVLAVADARRPPSSASPAFAASKTSWIISQSPSCRLFQSL